MVYLTWLSLALLGGFGLYRYVHRIPERQAPSISSGVVAPADGVIWRVVPLDKEDSEKELQIDKKFLGKIKTLSADVEGAAWLVSIFMNPLDCHANFSPVDGKILSIRHTPGNFSPANTWKSLWNEKNEILIQASGFKIKLIQIAGFLARRIECRVHEGETLTKGQVFGMIRLGSQVSLILPRRVKIRIETGQRVRGGETILGSWD